MAEYSNRVRLRQLHVGPDGVREAEPVTDLAARSMVVLQPHGSLFFASAPTLEAQLPHVRPDTAHSVVIIRLRGIPDIDLAAIAVLSRYTEQLAGHASTLNIVAGDQRVLAQLKAAGLTDAVGAGNVYAGSEWIGRSLAQAHADALAEVAAAPGDEAGDAAGLTS